MSAWPLVALGEVLTLTKRPVAVADLDEVSWAGARLYAEGIYARSVEPAAKVKTKTLNRLESEDITYNRMWATKAAFGVVGKDADGCLVTNDFPVFVADPERLLPAYIEAVFKTRAFQDEASSRAVGTTERRRLKEPDFLSIPIALPPLDEQRRIVDVMAAVDAQIEALGEELHALESLRVRALLNAAKDSTVAVDAIAVASQGKGLPKKLQGIRSGEVSWFKIADMTGVGNEDGYTAADTRMSAEDVASNKGVLVPAGAVVFPRVGAAVLTEKKRIMDVPGAVDENHLVLTPRDGVDSECLLAALESIRLADLVQTGAVPSLNLGLVRSTRVPWASTCDHSLGTSLGGVRQETRALRSELANLRAFRSTLLTALLTQEVEIPESYDTLLEVAS